MTWSRLRSIKRLIMSSVGSQLYKVQSRTISSSFNNTINGRLILLVLVTFHQEISWHYFILCWKVHCWKNYLILVANTNIFNLRDHLTNCFSTSIKKCLPTSNNFSHHCMLMLKVTGSRMSLFGEWDVMDTSSSQPHWITALRSPLYSICWMGFMCISPRLDSGHWQVSKLGSGPGTGQYKTSDCSTVNKINTNIHS